MLDLNSLLPANSGWTLIDAVLSVTSAVPVRRRGPAGRGWRIVLLIMYTFIHLFSDPAWDGEPVDETTTVTAGGSEREAGGGAEPGPPQPPRPPRPEIITVKLSDGSVRNIKSMTATMFWGADGTPLSAAQFLENLFGTLPEFFKNEDELRNIWSSPLTRKALLLGLEEKGFGKEVMAEMQAIIDAEKSDLYDVLAYVALKLEPITRGDRAAKAMRNVRNSFDAKQEAFIEFVLAQYVSQGVEELDAAKITPLLKLRYNDSLADAVADLGSPELIRNVFVGFQQYLYVAEAVAK